MASRKRVALELGGNGAVIVHGDADLAFAATRCTAIGAFANAGQVYVSPCSAWYVHSSFRLGRLRPAPCRRRQGHQNRRSRRRCDDLRTYDLGRSGVEGAERVSTRRWLKAHRALYLGERDGVNFLPVILTNTKPSMSVCADEVFAPVMVVEPYDDFAEAIDRVNEGEFGLQTGVFTRDVGQTLPGVRQSRSRRCHR